MSVIIYANPTNPGIAIFRLGANGRVNESRPRMFRCAMQDRQEERAVLPVPQFSSTVENSVLAPPSAATEGAVWSALFKENDASHLRIDDFIAVIEARNGLESVL
jgi:hypothetical protein